MRSQMRGVTRLFLVCLLGVLVACRAIGTSELEIFPKHFVLQPGEQIHYTVMEHSEGSPPRSADGQFAIENAEILRPITPTGVFEAVTPGLTELVARTPTSERRVTIEVAGPAQLPMTPVHHRALQEIVAKDVLFVGHANRDGWDHTAVAKPGIDRLVQGAKKDGWRVVYWVSQEYPNWYTADRHPDHAIISEGQEHQIRVTAERIMFAGGSFMFCVLRNVQMTLHGMAKETRAERIHFVFPAQAIWVEDISGPDDVRPIREPRILLATLFARRENDARAYDEVVVPFVDRVIKEFPLLGYPADAPAPPLSGLLGDWTIMVRLSDGFERVYRRADSHKTLLLEFQGV